MEFFDKLNFILKLSGYESFLDWKSRQKAAGQEFL